MKKEVTYIVLGLVLLAIIGTAIYFGIPNQAISGYSTLSISNVEVIDNGNFIRILGVSNGAEAMTFTFASSQIDSYINDDGYDATKSITGSITLDKQIKRFPLTKKTDQNFFELKTQKVGLFSSCPSSDGYVSLGSSLSLSLSKVCFYKRGIGTNSVFSGQSIRDSSVSVTIAGATGILNPSSGTNTLTLNDGKTKVEWVGDLSNFNQISAPFSYSALFQESKFQKLIDVNAYALAQDESIRFSSCMGKTSTASSVFSGGIFSLLSNLKTNSQIDSCINTYNNRVTNILTDKTITYTSSINADSIVFSDNSLDVDLKTADAFPTIIITIPAEKVGIKELSGIPDIASCVPDKKINSGDTINPTLSIKNIGSSDGSFSGSVTCSGTASATGIISETYFKAGETKSIPIQITGQNTIADTTKDATCTYTIQDRKSGKTDSCTSTLSVEYQSGLVCNPSSIKCVDANNLRTCSANGKTYEDKKCDLGCESLEDGTGQCKGVPPPPPKECRWFESYREEGSKTLGIFPGKQAGCYTAGWLYFVISIIVVLFLIFIFLVLMRLRK